MIILNKEEIQKCLPMKEAIEVCKESLKNYSENKTNIPLRINLSVEKYNGQALFMPGSISSNEEKVGIKIVYEPLTIYESNVTTTSNQLLELCNHFNSPYFFAMNDIVVPYIQGENIIAFNKKLGSKLVHMHIVDSDGQSEDHYCPGYGNLPLKNFMQELSQSGYDKTVTIELVTKYLNEPSIYAKLAIDNLKERL